MSGSISRAWTHQQVQFRTNASSKIEPTTRQQVQFRTNASSKIEPTTRQQVQSGTNASSKIEPSKFNLEPTLVPK